MSFFWSDAESSYQSKRHSLFYQIFNKQSVAQQNKFHVYKWLLPIIAFTSEDQRWNILTETANSLRNAFNLAPFLSKTPPLLCCLFGENKKYILENVQWDLIFPFKPAAVKPHHWTLTPTVKTLHDGSFFSKLTRDFIWSGTFLNFRGFNLQNIF